MVSNIPAILGAVVSVLCVRFNMPELLMIGRFITGINCGMYVCPSVCLSVCLFVIGSSCSKQASLVAGTKGHVRKKKDGINCNVSVCHRL